MFGFAFEQSHQAQNKKKNKKVGMKENRRYFQQLVNKSCGIRLHFVMK